MGGGYTEGVFLWLMEMAKRIVNEKEGESIEDVVDSILGRRIRWMGPRPASLERS